MFDIGWSELFVIAVVAIVVIGPKELPRLMRTFGHYTGKLRRAAADFQRQFEEAVRESELDEVRKAMHEVQATSADLSASIDKPVMTGNPPPAAAGPASLPPAPVAAKPKRKPAAKDNTKPKAATAKPRKPKEAKP